MSGSDSKDKSDKFLGKGIVTQFIGVLVIISPIIAIYGLWIHDPYKAAAGVFALVFACFLCFLINESD